MFLFYPDLCQVLKKSGWSVSEEPVDVFNKITAEQIIIDGLDFNDEEKLLEYCKVYPTYKRLLRKDSLFDFATIQETLLKEFQCNPKFAEAIKNNFDYFFADESQEFNNIQNLIFKTISALK